MYGTNENFENFLRDYMPKNSYFDKLQDFEMYLNAFVASPLYVGHRKLRSVTTGFCNHEIKWKKRLEYII